MLTKVSKKGPSTDARQYILRVSQSFVLLFLISTLLRGGETHKDVPPGDLLIRIYEGQTDLSKNGLNFHNCLQVRQDGHFHLERRVQRLPARTATLKVFDSSLDTAQLSRLKEILADEQLNNLTPYREPEVPMAAPWVLGLRAEIARGAALQTIGYWSWKGGSLDGSPNSTPKKIKVAWRDSETVMKSLSDWFHSVEGLNLEPTNTPATMCGAHGIN